MSGVIARLCLLAAGFGIISNAGVAAAATGPTLSAVSFNNKLMVDTHLAYTDSTYGLIRNSQGQYVPATSYVKAAADYAGINIFRDGISNGEYGSSPLSYYQGLAKLGIRYVTIASGNTQADLLSSLQLIDSLNGTSGAPGHVLAIEGANEINNTPACWGPAPCQGGLPGALARQSTLLALVRTDTSLPRIGEVLYFTGWDGVAGAPGPDPVFAGYADADNQHPYPPFGQPPYAWLARARSLPNTVHTLERTMFTETGYAAGPLFGPACNAGQGGVCWNNNGGYGSKPQVDETVQAKETLDIPFDAALLSIEKIAIYQLLSGYAEQGPKDDGFGLFHYSDSGTLSPRPVATAIKNLTTITRDNLSPAVATPLNYQVSGLPASGFCAGLPVSKCTFTPTLALQKSNGQYIVAVWAEPQIWDPDNHVEIPAAAQPVTLTLDRIYSKIEVYDPMISATAQSSVSSASTLQTSVTDHPILIVVTP